MVVGGIAVAALGDLTARGVAVIGALDGAVPVPAIPSVGWDDLVGLLPGGSFQGFITGGGASQSAANDRAGAQTQLVSLLVSGLTVATAVALLPLFRDLPQAALGAVVISAVIGFLDLAAMERVRRLRRDSFAIALVVMIAVLALGVLQGLLLAVVVSVGELLIRSSRPSRSVLGRLPGTTAFVARENAPEALTVPGMLVYRLNAPLLFVNAKRLRDGIRAELRDADPRTGSSCSTCRSPQPSTSPA